MDEVVDTTIDIQLNRVPFLKLCKLQAYNNCEVKHVNDRECTVVLMIHVFVLISKNRRENKSVTVILFILRNK